MTNTPIDYMRTAPWDHQLADYLASRDLPAAAYPWEPRCGKTKISLDLAGYLLGREEIDAVVVLAPNGVHLNWTRQEIPTHWGFPVAPFVVEWDARRAGTKRFQERLKQALDVSGPVFLAVNLEAVATPKLVNLRKTGGMGYLERFVRRRRCLLLVDESHGIKNPGAQRTKAVHRIAERCPYRRILTGTPVAQGPFDLWAQYYTLDPSILGPRFTNFRARYAVFKKNKEVVCQRCKVRDDYDVCRQGAKQFTKCRQCGHQQPVFGPLYDELVEYRNLDELNRRIAPYTFPRKKAECLDLPERLMDREFFVLPPEHRRVYDELRDELIARLDNGEVVTAAHALTNLLRLQQISRGAVTLEDRTVRDLGGPYPAADAALRLLTQHDGKSIVWCRFRSDVDLLEKVFTAAGRGVIRCDGSVPQADRPALLARFRDDPDADTWLGTLATGGVGVDLGAASLMVFYSHGFDLVQRLQGLERNYGSSQKASRVDVVDLVAADTADLKALKALERKQDLASQLDGRTLRELIT